MNLIITIALLSGLALADSTQYFSAICQAGLRGVQIEDWQRTTAACSNVGGKRCAYGCVVTGSIGTPDGTRALWKKACADAGAESDEIRARESVERAEYFAGCGEPVPSGGSGSTASLSIGVGPVGVSSGGSVGGSSGGTGLGGLGFNIGGS